MRQCSMVQVAWLVHLEHCPLHHAKIGALPFAPWRNCSLACHAMLKLVALPATSFRFHCFSQMRPILQCPGGYKCALIPAKATICCRRVPGCHPLPSCLEEVLGTMWSRQMQVVVDKVLCLNGHNGGGPATDSLDHRNGACYLPCSLSYDEHHHAHWHALTVGSPLCIIEMCFTLS